MRKLLLPVIFLLSLFIAITYSPSVRAAELALAQACDLYCTQAMPRDDYCPEGEMALRPPNTCTCDYYCYRTCSSTMPCPAGEICNFFPSFTDTDRIGRCSGGHLPGSSSSSLSSFKKISPANSVTLPYGTHVFTWSAVANSSAYSTSYTLDIVDPATGKTLKSFRPAKPSDTSALVSLPSISDLQPGHTYQWTVWYSDGSRFRTEADAGTKWSFTVAPASLISCVTASQDAYVQENSPGSNFGSSAQVRTGTIASGLYYYLAYFLFNVFPVNNTSAFPSNYDVAVFRVHQAGNEGYAGGLPVLLRKITSMWNEATVTWNNKPTFDAGSWGSQEVGGWGNNNTWYAWDITSYLKSTTIPYGLALMDARYNPTCDGSTIATCRAGAPRDSYLDSKEAAANKPQICFYNTCTPPPACLCATGRDRCYMPWRDEYCTCPTSSSSSSVCSKDKGDANCKDGVTLADYDIWKCEYLGGGTCTATTPSTTKTADFDNNGRVDLVDFEIWRNTYYNSN